MIDYSKRRLLTYGGASLLALTVADLAWNVPSVMRLANAAENAESPLAPASQPFTTLAKALTGSVDAAPALVQRVYTSLLAAYPDLDTVAPVLTAQLTSHATGPFTLADAHLQEIYTQTLQALYLGVIGPAKTPRCIAFENIVSYKVVANAYYPPSYCSGQAGFWVNKPSNA